MHPRPRARTRTLASATVLALLAVPGTAFAAPDPDPEGLGSVAVRPVPDAARPAPKLAPDADPADKITPAARKAFAAPGDTTFWLRFADKPDLSAAGGITSWSERGEYVYETLRATAEAAQKDAVAELEKSGTEYTSYWATNAILVEDASLGLATDLAADNEVLEIRPTAHYEAPEPVEVVDAADVTPSAAGKPTWGITAINADDLWAEGITGDGIVVAGIDTGVNTAIPSVRDRYRGAATGSDDYNWYDAAGLGHAHPEDADQDGHGTHTMGTMVGGTQTWNQVDHQFGVAPGAEWVATNGCADQCADQALISSGEWILAPTRADGTDPSPAMRPHVVNNSWGSIVPSTDPFMEDILTAWEAAGVFATFSNGNLGEEGCQSSGSPGSRQASYSVGAFTGGGVIAPYSARGSGEGGAVKPDIAAPGTSVFSSLPGGLMGYLSGTSMAAPHVAGAVALLWDAVPELVGNVPATRAILDGSARDVNDTTCGGTADDNNVWGEGKLDVLAAYELAQGEQFETATAPVISGTGYKVGEPLTATVGAWSPAAAFTYQWRRDGQMIPGATEAGYTPRDADRGLPLSVTVVGTAEGYIPTAVESAETPVVGVGDLTASTPKIDGTVRVGSTLRALAGSWTSGTRFTYQWYADGGAISGATGFTFTPTASHLGKRLTVRLNGSRAGYTAATRTSAASAAVAAGVFSQSAPVIVGPATPGVTLTVSRPQSTPVPSTVTYRWRLDGTAIRGATRSTLTMRSEWKGRLITVGMTVSQSGYTTKSVTSASLRVGGKYSKSPNPVISGTQRVGSTLTVTRGTWSPTPSSFSYQWYANGQPISGATASKYTLTGSDYQKKITVSVRTYRAGYGTVLRRSAATGEVLASAVRWRGDDEYALPVGSGGVSPTTYIAQAGSASCEWGRQSPTKVLAYDVGSGQRLFRVIGTDDSVFASENCGIWIKYYSGMVRTGVSTAANGVYVLGDHIERGVYSTSGPADADSSCRYIFFKGFSGYDDAIGWGEVTEATTITMPSSATGFETVNCSWKRIG